MRWSMVPVSICAHVVVGIVAVIVPLAAEDEWPAPAPLHSLVVAMKAVPVPPSVAPPAAVRRAAPAAVTMPSSLEPERETPPIAAGPAGPDVAVDGGIGPVNSGAPGGLGSGIAVPPPPPPPAAQPQAPVRPGGNIREPKKIFDVPPVYPAIATSVRIEGMVILEAVINERGGVERVKILRSVPFLDGAAVEAVKQWRYTPTLLNGTPVPVLLTITINFTLRD
jgi:protein TonB